MTVTRSKNTATIKTTKKYKAKSRTTGTKRSGGKTQLNMTMQNIQSIKKLNTKKAQNKAVMRMINGMVTTLANHKLINRSSSFLPRGMMLYRVGEAMTIVIRTVKPTTTKKRKK